MSDVAALSANASLWDPVTKAMWGSHDFCLMLTTFHMWAIMQAQLIALSLEGAWGNREAQVRHGIFISSTQHCHQVWKGVQPHCSVGTSAPSPLPNSTRGSLQTCGTSRCKRGLAICLHVTEWCCGSCACITWEAHQHHDRQCAQHWCPWPAASVAIVQAVAAWGEGSVSRGLKQASGGPTVHFPRVTPLGCCHTQWDFLKTMISRSGSQLCAAWEHDNCHSGSYHYTGANWLILLNLPMTLPWP